MVTPLQNTLNALKALDKKMQVTANNVANVNTNGYKKRQAILLEGQNGEIKVDVHKAETPGYPTEQIQNDKVVQTETSNVDIAEEFTESIITQNAYNANLKLVKVQDEILGSLLDIIG